MADYNRPDLLAAKLNGVFIRMLSIIKQEDRQNEPHSTVFKRRFNRANTK